jgi:hypothetical protein
MGNGHDGMHELLYDVGPPKAAWDAPWQGIAFNLGPKLRLGTVNATGSSASTTQSWSFSSDCVPKLELGNEKLIEEPARFRYCKIPEYPVKFSVTTHCRHQSR